MKSYLQESDKENQTSVSNSIETLNEVTFESEESVLSNQSTLSTLDYEPISDPFGKLKNTRLKNPNRLIIAQLNINSLRNKFDSLVRMLHNNLDILLISETKIDSSFPTAQFQIEGYTTYRLDRNANGGGILLYIREDIPSTLLNFDMSIESFFIEINIRKKKWLLVGTYNPNKNLISNHLKEIGKNLDNYSSKYDNFILLGDLNSEPTESAVKDFCEIYSCKNLIKDKTCFKNPLKPSYIDLIITNRPKSFQNSVTVETGLSDFHKMTLTVMKVFYKKQKPNIVTYRNYKHFSNEAFMLDVKNSIIQMTSENNDLEFDRLKTALDEAIQRHAPIKKRYVRANQVPFINKKINKEIMKRSRLRNKFLNTKKDIDRKAYNKQRNLCVSLIRIEKKNFFSNINTSDITDNYRPVSILCNFSKIYERCIYDQIQLFFDSLLSKYQCGFRRGYNAQHCLITLIEKWKKSVDNGGAFGALLNDLSKALDCLPHELLIAKLDAYGFDKSSLKLMHSYLSNRKQRVKINDNIVLGARYCLEFHKGQF